MELSITESVETDSILRLRNTNNRLMKVDEDLVKGVAALAQLDISSDELANTIESLTEVLDLVDQMQNINTDGIEPMANPLDAKQVLRVDEVTETNQRDQLQKSAPKVESGFFLVPRVVE